MHPIPLNFQTLYADLAQNARASSHEFGSVVTRRKKGNDYLFVIGKDGTRHSEKYIGPAGDAAAEAHADSIRQGQAQARVLRATVSALKQARVPAPSMALGRVLEVVANAGLFQQGLVLVGTAAYITYGGMLGAYLTGAALMTNDADFLVASFIGTGPPQDMETILKKADPTFKSRMNQDDVLPKVFQSDNTFAVEILTKLERGRKSPVLLEALGVSAVALPFMEYLAEESVEVVALYGPGVIVRVPPPLRYAAHKLLIAQERNERAVIKKSKDLLQAKELIGIASVTGPEAWTEVLDEVRRRGPKWKRNIDASLREIDHQRRR